MDFRSNVLFFPVVCTSPSWPFLCWSDFPRWFTTARAIECFSAPKIRGSGRSEKRSQKGADFKFWDALSSQDATVTICLQASGWHLLGRDLECGWEEILGISSFLVWTCVKLEVKYVICTSPTSFYWKAWSNGSAFFFNFSSLFAKQTCK